MFGCEWRVPPPTHIRRQDLGARLRALATGNRSGASKSTRGEHGATIPRLTTLLVGASASRCYKPRSLTAVTQLWAIAFWAADRVTL
jgi:hypothetical protein